MTRWLAAMVAAVAVAAAVILLIGSSTGDGPTGSSDALGSASTLRAPADADGDADAAGVVGDPMTSSIPSTTPTSATDQTTAIDQTTDTVEADDATPEPSDPGETDGDDPDVPDETAPTVPAPTSGLCRITMADLAGRSGAVEPAGDGACAAVGVTIQAVNPRDDLSSVDWGRAIEICQRHPAAAAIGVEVTTGAGVVDLADGLSRSPQEAEADPVQSIAITFAGQEVPLTGPRPIASCRTATAEISLVHQPAG